MFPRGLWGTNTGHWRRRPSISIVLAHSGYGEIMKRRRRCNAVETLEVRDLLSGLRLIADTNATPASSNPEYFTVFGDHTYFVATDIEHGREIWRTDRTAEGTELAFDLIPGSRGGADAAIAASSESLLFLTDGGVVFESDGLELRQLLTGIKQILIHNDELYALAYDGLQVDCGFCRVDVETGEVHQLKSGAGYSILSAGDLILVDDAEGLHVTNGTEPTVLVAEELRIARSVPGAIGDSVLFVGTDSIHGNELWSTDGTASGTRLVADIRPGSSSSIFGSSVLGVIEGKLYFRATSSSFGPELWVSDGESAWQFGGFEGAPGELFQDAQGEWLLSAASLYRLDLDAGEAHLVSRMGSNEVVDPLSGYVVFDVGDRLWQTNGTDEGTRPLTPPTSRTPPFARYDRESGLASIGGEPYVVNVGVPVAKLAEIHPGTESTVHRGFVPFKGEAIAASGWATDGTLEGSGQIQERWPETNLSLRDPFPVGRRLFLEGWRSGSYYAAVTNGVSRPRVLTPALESVQFLTSDTLGRAYFTARVEGSTFELWVSDASKSGTKRLLSSDVYFEAHTGASAALRAGAIVRTGDEIWLTDGTPEGTSQVASTESGNGIVSATVGGKDFFSVTYADDQNLRVTDGTASGTREIEGVSGVRELMAFDDALYVTTRSGLSRINTATERVEWTYDSRLVNSMTVFGDRLLARVGSPFGDAGILTIGDSLDSVQEVFRGSSVELHSANLDVLLFVADGERDEGPCLWRMDRRGVAKVGSVHRSSAEWPIDDMVAIDERRFVMLADNGFSGKEPWLYENSGDVDLTEDGILEVRGTSGDDSVRIKQDGDLLIVHMGDVEFGHTRSAVQSVHVELLDGDDSIEVTTLVDVHVDAGAGKDRITTGPGDDTVFGGPGRDRIRTGSGSDLINGGSGSDSIRAGRGADTIAGAKGDDSISGGFGNDIIRGGQGADVLAGSSGDDVLSGGSGDDRLSGDAGQDLLFSGMGSDTADGGTGEDLLVGGKTRHDEHVSRLMLLRDEWTSGSIQPRRIANLTNSGAGEDRQNGNVFIRRDIEVTRDPEADVIAGGADTDWFFAEISLDSLPDLISKELVN